MIDQVLTAICEIAGADEGEIAEYAKYQVRWAKGAGIISGRPDGSFGPKDNATRAESAAMLSRLVK